MFYIHQTTCISPQGAFLNGEALSGDLRGPVDGLMKAIEPAAYGVPPGILRRMSKSVRMGVGAALSLLQPPPDGILIGTGNGGMEDSVKFLQQIIDYNEGMLAPGTFVQSTSNAIASQTGLISHNKGYNITHVHRGAALEGALIDAAMLLAAGHSGASYLAGGVDEISAHHHAFEQAEGWYDNGLAAGEGAAMFLVRDTDQGALAEVADIRTFYSTDPAAVRAQQQELLARHGAPDLLLTGEHGNRTLPWYACCEAMMDQSTAIGRYKHLCGEYPTAVAFALWLVCQLRGKLPEHMIKRPGEKKEFRRILLYNNYQLSQHSWILLRILP